jgi:hypothetical protein
VDLRRVDGQCRRWPRVSRRSVQLTAVVEVLSCMVDMQCGGQGCEPGDGECGELHLDKMSEDRFKVSLNPLVLPLNS